MTVAGSFRDQDKRRRLPPMVCQEVVRLYSLGLGGATIAKKVGVCLASVYNVLRREGVEVRTSSQVARRYKLNESFFSAINSEEKAYWVGFLAADGAVVSRDNAVVLQLGEKDRKHVERFREDLQSSNRIRTIKGSGWSGVSARFVCQSKKMVADLAAVGIVPRKTFTLGPIKVPGHFCHHALRGYFDGDGCVGIYGGKAHFSICSGSQQFLSWIAGLIQAATSTRARVRKVKQKNAWVFETTGNKVVGEIGQLLYHRATIFLPRKKQIFDEIPSITVGGLH